MITFTVFTPTYNRAHTLHRVYSSLQNQTYLDFEWIIVDDGSSDDTRIIVENWINEGLFPIKYFYKENEGKHIAINFAVKVALGEYFIIADSDDAFESNTLERFIYHWKKIKEEGKYFEFASVKALCKEGNTCEPLPSFLGSDSYADLNHLDLTYRERDLYEKWDCHRTAVMVEYPFPSEYKKLYFSEGVIWNRMARKYLIRAINEPLRIYFNTENSLMNNRDPNPLNYTVAIPYVLNEQLDYYFQYPELFSKITILYVHYSQVLNRSILEQLKFLNGKAKILYVVLLPISLIWSKFRAMKKRLKFIFERIQQEKKPIRFLLSIILKKTHLCTFFTINRGSYILRFYPTALSGSLWVDPDDRHTDEDFIVSYLQPGETFIDVGANIGSLSLAASTKVQDSGTVLSIEAHPRTYKYMCLNFKLNDVTNISPINTALGNEIGELCFSDTNTDDQNKIVTDSDSHRTIRVPVDTLDSLASKFTTINLLKIDVEGFELFVLEGASNTLRRCECVYFESWEKHFNNFGYKTSNVLNLLSGYEFVFFKTFENNFTLIDSKSYMSLNCENIIAVKDVNDFKIRVGKNGAKFIGIE